MRQVDDILPGRWVHRLGWLWHTTKFGSQFTAKARSLIEVTILYQVSPWIQNTFPNYWLFLALFVPFRLFLAYLDWFARWPADIHYSNHHNQQEGRSPIMDRLAELEEKIDRQSSD